MTDSSITKKYSSIGSHLEDYLRSGGASGHVQDNRGSGGHRFGTALLIRYAGRKSGRTLITPLTYASIGGEVVIAASKGGAPEHPAWYLNLIAAKHVDFQIATQAFRATWREPEAAERDKVWARMVDNYPFYGEYRKLTDRIIPLVMMSPVEGIPVFSATDMG